MKFVETKEEQIQYVENDIERLEKEYHNYKLRAGSSAFLALICCLSAVTLSILQSKAFFIYCLVTATLVLTIAAIICLINQSGYPENISARKSALNLMKNDYEAYIERKGQELIHAARHMPAVTDNKPYSPKCPVCGSYDLLPITPIRKTGKIFLWGIFAIGDISKTWKCNSCGSKF